MICDWETIVIKLDILDNLTLFQCLVNHLGLAGVKCDEHVALEPVSHLNGRWFLNGDHVVQVALARAFLGVHGEVLDPGSLLRYDFLAFVVHVGQPEHG